jgi:DNA-nicking Smr family endonuclease
MSNDEATFGEAVEVPITDEIDLHSFDPRDIPAVVGEYLDRCREIGFTSVRVIHGRGRGVQRAVVRRALAGRSDIESFEDAPPGLGGWGATLVRLRP